MSFLRRISSVFDWRSDGGSSRPADDDDRWYSPFVAPTASGIHVTPENAIGTVAVYAAVAAISQSIGSLPFLTYERQANGGRERAIKSPFYYLFAVAPNDWMSSGEWVEMVFVHLLLRGNAYNFKLRDRSGRIIGLIPLNPARMEVQQLDNLAINYRYVFQSGETRNLSQREIMHFRTGFSDGLVGRSPITVARETAALTIACERYAGRFFKNSAKPSGVLSHPAKLTKETSDRIRESWQKAHAGDEEAWKVAVLEEGMKFEPITMNGRDAQFVEQRRFQLEEVARMFRVPPHIMGDLSRATFSNIEHQSINFVVYCLMPYIRRFEQTIQMNFFLNAVGGKELYAEFLVDGLLRGDTKSRQEGFEIMRRNGVLSANEWRRFENMSPTEDGAGDKYIVPMNMTWAELLGREAEKDSAQEETETVPEEDSATNKEPDEEKEDTSRVEEDRTLRSDAKVVATRMFAEILERLTYKEAQTLSSLAKKDDAREKTEEFILKHESTCRSALETPLRFYSAVVSEIRGQKEDPEAIDLVWNTFWKSYRASIGERGGVRALNLSETICRLIDFRYLQSHLPNGEQNGTGKQEGTTSSNNNPA